MRTIKKLFATLGLVFLATAQASPEVGDKISAELKIQTDQGLKRIPIPQGEWVVLQVRKTEGTPKFGGTKANKFTQVIAFQTHNAVMTKMLDITVNATSEVPRYTDEFCKPYINGRFYEDRYISEVWEVACLQVYHLTEFLAVSGADKEPWTTIRSHFRSKGISYPNSLLVTWYRRYNERGQWLSYRLTINPSALGFEDFAGKWADSPWHKDFLAKEPRRLDLMKSVLAQGKEIQVILDEHFKNPIEKSTRAGFDFEFTANQGR